MKTPQHEIDQLREVLNDRNIELLKDDLAFGVARCIVQYKDPDFLKKWPQWISELVYEMCEIYQRDGNYGYVSNMGEVDHSAMVKELVDLLMPTAAGLGGARGSSLL